MQMLLNQLRLNQAISHLPEAVAAAAHKVDDGIAWYADQRERGKHPANTVRPVWIGIASIVIRGLLVVDQTQYPNGLEYAYSESFLYNFHLALTKSKQGPSTSQQDFR